MRALIHPSGAAVRAAVALIATVALSGCSLMASDPEPPDADVLAEARERAVTAEREGRTIDAIEAYRRVKESGRFEEVLSASGRNRRHYALTDHKEFFAELTESAFGTNDFYPFVRAELLKDDPQSLEVVERLWRDPRR